MALLEFDLLKFDLINFEEVTLIPRLDKKLLSNLSASAAPASVIASRILLFPLPFSPIKRLILPNLISSS